MSIVRQGTLPVGSLDHAITLNVQSSGGSHFETVTDTTPYLHRASPQDVASSMKLKKVVGGTVAWNQLLKKEAGAMNSNSGTKTYDSTTNTFTVTLSTPIANIGLYTLSPLRSIANHKYLMSADINPSLAANLLLCVEGGSFYKDYGLVANAFKHCESITTNATPSKAFVIYLRTNGLSEFSVQIRNINIIDLTQMFGSTIADYIYSLEQAHAGDGVAWFKALYGEDYYPYNAGELMSVKTSARKTYNADNVEIGSYPLDDNLTLRGIPKLDADHNLYYDGDTYASDGTVTRKYGTYTFTGDEEWTMYVAGGHNTFNSGNRFLTNGVQYGSAIMDKEYQKSSVTYIGGMANKTFQFFSSPSFSVTDDSYTSATDFAQHMAGRVLVYELATPTTESADAYTLAQRVGATEEFVDGRTVEIPVGNVSEYKRLIQGDTP